MVRYNLESVKQEFAEQGYKLIEETYKNPRTRMKYVCEKHPNKEQLMTYESLRKGSRCGYCSGRGVLDIEDAHELFKSKGYVLIETEYKTAKTRMLFECPNHPNDETKISVDSLLSGSECILCSREKSAAKRRNCFEEVKDAFTKRGYSLLTKQDEYVDNKQLLEYICPQHPEKTRTISYNNLYSKGAGCKVCSGKDDVDIEMAVELFDSKGLDLLEIVFKDVATGMRYKCRKHPEYIQKLRYNSVQQGVGCRYCAIKSGEDSPNWRGGVTTLNAYLREKLNSWRYAQIKRSGEYCDITGSDEDIAVHHLRPFYKIRDEALEKLGLGEGRTVSEYTQEQLDALLAEVIKIHEDVVGVPLQSDVHRLFHSMYGYNTDEDDYREFKENYCESQRLTNEIKTSA